MGAQRQKALDFKKWGLKPRSLAEVYAYEIGHICQTDELEHAMEQYTSSAQVYKFAKILQLF